MEWKTIAIIFIILFTLETLFFCFSLKVGLDLEEKEKECAYDICQDQSAYLFDDYTNICYCFDNGKQIKEQYVT